MPTQILNYKNEGLGKVRTEAFNLNDIYNYYDPHRFKYNYDELMEDMNDSIDQAAYAKA